jgi:hypothetical protein
MRSQLKHAHESRLYEACEVLFGSHIDISKDFLFYIQSAGIKRAYRKRALETHPDRFVHRADVKNNAEMFIETNQAYELLTDFIKSRDNPALRRTITKKRPRRTHSNRRAARRHGNFYKGKIPSRQLHLGQYLFYSGSISWETLIKAIIWQRSQRPRMGDIARGWRMLNDRQIVWLISQRKLGEKLGETAVRLKILKKHQVNTMMYHQGRQQRPFGEYFVIHNILGQAELDRLVHTLKEHNRGFRKQYHRPRRRYS